MASLKKKLNNEPNTLSQWEDLLSFCSQIAGDYKKLEETIGYQFKNISLLYEALTHKSALLAFAKHKKVSHYSKLGLSHYERIEFLGDSVLGLIISSSLWSTTNPDTNKLYSEGELSKIKAFLVSENTLAKMARNLELEKFILLSKAEKTNGGSQRKSLLADCFESIIGAIFYDGGYNQARQWIKKIYQDILKENLLEVSLDYKSKLQEVIQEKEKQSPHYETLETSGPDHEKKFKVGVYFDKKRLGSAWGESKKTASQKAAKEALKNLKNNNDKK